MTDMQPEYTASLFQPHLTSPGRKRRRDEPSTLGELDLDLDLMATSWDGSSATHPTFSRPFGNTQYQVHVSSKPSTLRIKHQHTPRTHTTATAAIIHKPPVNASPRHKRSKANLSSSSNISLTTTARSRSPSPMAYSQEMQLSPQFKPAALSVKTTSNPTIKPPAIQGQRCHICSRAQLLTFASTITSCEQCDKPTCGVCARECTSCDERVCGKCCKEKGDFTFCVACYRNMERHRKA